MRRDGWRRQGRTPSEARPPSDERDARLREPDCFQASADRETQGEGTESPWTLAQLQRHMAYDRLLERLYLTSDGWIVKGATALLARDIGVRATIDIDVYREV